MCRITLQDGDEEKDIKPDIASATESPNDKGKAARPRTASPSPAQKARPASPATSIRRDSSPAGPSSRNASMDRGSGGFHAVAQRAISPHPGQPTASKGKKRKNPPVASSAPPESGSEDRSMSPGPAKKRRHNTVETGAGNTSSTVVPPQVTAPVVQGSGGMASAATGHAPIKAHKARGKSNKAAAGKPGPSGLSVENTGSTTVSPTGSTSGSSRQGSPAPTKPSNGSPKPNAKRASPAVSLTPAQMQDLRGRPFANAINYDDIAGYLRRSSPNGKTMSEYVRDNPALFSLTAPNVQANQGRVRLLLLMFGANAVGDVMRL